MSDPPTPTSTDGARTPKSKSQRGAVTMEVSMVTLQLLKDAAEASPIPGLGAIPSLALQILTAGAKDNKDAFKRLAGDAFAVATVVVEGCQKLEADGKNPPGLQEQLGALKRTMEAIIDFTNRRAGRNAFMRMATSRADVNDIQDYRQQLNQAMHIFAVQSQIDIRATLSRVEALLKNQQSESVELPPSSPAPSSESSLSTPTQQFSSKNPFKPSSTPFTPPLNTDVSPHSSPPSYASPVSTSSPFSILANSQNASITGSITMNNVSGDQNITTNNVNNSNVNTGNVYHRTRYNMHAGPVALRHMSVPGYNPGHWQHNFMGSHQNMLPPGTSRRGRGPRQTFDAHSYLGYGS
ncbi:hypothetical protein WG66_004344 [Moniliophthora roreri]|uniref:Uncharacterized protein n=1 Tax=Moniliophthora roreri TaxID=221103 RepID=A0A0W0FVF2_MONRR|nr:hypothetical protein WG66_004344 [Moniliophthora roreri]